MVRMTAGLLAVTAGVVVGGLAVLLTGAYHVDSAGIRAIHRVVDTDGRGLPKDAVSAYVSFSLAASRSAGEIRERAIALRDALAEQMTREQLAEALRLAREWQAAHTQPEGGR